MHKIISPLRGEEVHGKDEAEYFREIVSHINTGVDHTFIFTVWEWPIVDPPEGTIVFSTSDESHKQPIQSHLHPNVLAVFKQYWPVEPICDDRVFPMPLGCLTNFAGNSNTPMRDREFDYSFSGMCNDNGRDSMMVAVNRRKKDGLNKYVAFTGDKWGQGLKMCNYGSLLAKTKIALCPPGFLSAESFRIFEAARCGCVLLVGTNNNSKYGKELIFPKDVWYYKDFPGIMLDDWSDLSIIDKLLRDPQRLQEISDATVDWYNRCVDPQAVGAWMTERIKERMI